MAMRLNRSMVCSDKGFKYVMKRRLELINYTNCESDAKLSKLLSFASDLLFHQIALKQFVFV